MLTKKVLIVICVIMLLTPSIALANIPGGATCTPGFWKQPQHFIYWEPSGLNPSDPYNADMTLLDALQGGYDTRESRFIVAGMLNAFYDEFNTPCPEDLLLP
jgi:hypothetical protein